MKIVPTNCTTLETTVTRRNQQASATDKWGRLQIIDRKTNGWFWSSSRSDLFVPKFCSIKCKQKQT